MHVHTPVAPVDLMVQYTQIHLLINTWQTSPRGRFPDRRPTGLLPTDMTAHRAPVTTGQALASEAHPATQAGAGVPSRPHDVIWPFAASLNGPWVHFPAAGACMRDLGAGAVRACRDF